MTIKYIIHTFSYAFTQVPPPFPAITTSSSNMLHASSCSRESNHISGIHWFRYEIHISSILFMYNNIFRVEHRLLACGLLKLSFRIILFLSKNWCFQGQLICQYSPIVNMPVPNYRTWWGMCYIVFSGRLLRRSMLSSSVGQWSLLMALSWWESIGALWWWLQRLIRRTR
jgi:hypothetical protein